MQSGTKSWKNFHAFICQHLTRTEIEETNVVGFLYVSSVCENVLCDPDLGSVEMNLRAVNCSEKYFGTEKPVIGYKL